MAKGTDKQPPTTFLDTRPERSLEDVADDVRASRAGRINFQELSPATAVSPQDLMRAEMEQQPKLSTLSREGHLHRRTGELVEEITMESDLKLTPLEWAAVRELVRQGVQAGRELERDL